MTKISKKALEELKDKLVRYKTLIEAYRRIIMRYEDQINANEEKTIPQLKALVKPDDETVQKIKGEINEKEKEEMINKIGKEPLYEKALEYDYQRDFLKYVEDVLKYIENEIRPIGMDLGVYFWYRPKEIAEMKAADPFDRAVFLCSLLRAGNSESAKILVVELEGGLEHPLVSFSFGGREYFIDAMQPSKGIMKIRRMKRFKYKDKKILRILYEFNDKEYKERETI